MTPVADAVSFVAHQHERTLPQRRKHSTAETRVRQPFWSDQHKVDGVCRHLGFDFVPRVDIG